MAPHIPLLSNAQSGPSLFIKGRSGGARGAGGGERGAPAAGRLPGRLVGGPLREVRRPPAAGPEQAEPGLRLPAGRRPADGGGPGERAEEALGERRRRGFGGGGGGGGGGVGGEGLVRRAAACRTAVRRLRGMGGSGGPKSKADLAGASVARSAVLRWRWHGGCCRSRVEERASRSVEDRREPAALSANALASRHAVARFVGEAFGCPECIFETGHILQLSSQNCVCLLSGNRIGPCLGREFGILRIL